MSTVTSSHLSEQVVQVRINKTSAARNTINHTIHTLKFIHNNHHFHLQRHHRHFVNHNRTCAPRSQSVLTPLNPAALEARIITLIHQTHRQHLAVVDLHNRLCPPDRRTGMLGWKHGLVRKLKNDQAAPVWSQMTELLGITL